MFPIFRISGNTSSVPSRRRIYRSNCYINSQYDTVLNGDQNSVLDPNFDRPNNITHFPGNSISKTSFQCLNIYRVLIGCYCAVSITNSKLSVN